MVEIKTVFSMLTFLKITTLGVFILLCSRGLIYSPVNPLWHLVAFTCIHENEGFHGLIIYAILYISVFL